MCARRNRSGSRSWSMSEHRSAPDSLPAARGDRPKASARALAQVIERSSRMQGPAAEAYVARLRRAYPDASPAEIVAKLEKRYLAALTASGAAVGSAATFPGVGTLTAMSAGAGETVFFLEATAVRQYQRCLAHRCDQVGVIERLRQVHLWVGAERRVGHLAHVRVRVDRVDDVEIGEAGAEFGDRG